MRAVRCWCEELVTGRDDEELAAALREHVREEHPGEERSEDELHARIEAEAYEPPDRPGWAY